MLLISGMFDQIREQRGVQQLINLVLGTLRNIRAGPAHLFQTVFIFTIWNQSQLPFEHRYDALQLIVLRNSFAPAHIQDGPKAIIDERLQSGALCCLRLTQFLDQWSEDARPQKQVSRLRAVSSNVSEAPDDLLDQLLVFGVLDEPHEVWDYAGVDQVADVVRISGGDVGQAPGGFELETRELVMEELEEHVGQVCLDYAVDRGTVFNREKFSEADQGQYLGVGIGSE